MLCRANTKSHISFSNVCFARTYASQALEAALRLFETDSESEADSSSRGSISATELRQLVKAATHIDLTESEALQLMQETQTGTESEGHALSTDLHVARDLAVSNSTGSNCISFESFRRLFVSGRFCRAQRGRCLVALSLAEAETVRRIMHVRQDFPVMPAESSAVPSDVDPNRMSVSVAAPESVSVRTTMALRCLPNGFSITDRSFGFTAAEEAEAGRHDVGAAAEADVGGEGRDTKKGQELNSFALSPAATGANTDADTSALSSAVFMTQSSLEALRFFNCEMFYSDRSLNTLLRALHFTSAAQRRLFFKSALMCRRRAARKWNETPVAKVFRIPDVFSLLKQRAQAARLRSAIGAAGNPKLSVLRADELNICNENQFSLRVL